MTHLDKIKDQSVRTFMDHVRKSPGQQWMVRKIFETDRGWRVQWTVGDRWLRVQPAGARKLARALIADYTAYFRSLPFETRNTFEEKNLLDWLDTFDNHAKDCLKLNRAGATPEQVAA